MSYKVADDGSVTYQDDEEDPQSSGDSGTPSPGSSGPQGPDASDRNASLTAGGDSQSSYNTPPLQQQSDSAPSSTDDTSFMRQQFLDQMARTNAANAQSQARDNAPWSPPPENPYSQAGRNIGDFFSRFGSGARSAAQGLAYRAAGQAGGSEGNPIDALTFGITKPSAEGQKFAYDVMNPDPNNPLNALVVGGPELAAGAEALGPAARSLGGGRAGGIFDAIASKLGLLNGGARAAEATDAGTLARLDRYTAPDLPGARAQEYLDTDNPAALTNRTDALRSGGEGEPRPNYGGPGENLGLEGDINGRLDQYVRPQTIKEGGVGEPGVQPRPVEATQTEGTVAPGATPTATEGEVAPGVNATGTAGEVNPAATGSAGTIEPGLDATGSAGAIDPGIQPTGTGGLLGAMKEKLGSVGGFAAQHPVLATAGVGLAGAEAVGALNGAAPAAGPTAGPSVPAAAPAMTGSATPANLEGNRASGELGSTAPLATTATTVEKPPVEGQPAPYTPNATNTPNATPRPGDKNANGAIWDGTAWVGGTTGTPGPQPTAGGTPHPTGLPPGVPAGSTPFSSSDDRSIQGFTYPNGTKHFFQNGKEITDPKAPHGFVVNPTTGQTEATSDANAIYQQMQTDLQNIIQQLGTSASPDVLGMFLKQSQSIIAMIDEQEAKAKADAATAGSATDPAQQAAFAQMKIALQKQLDTTKEDLNRRGLLDSGVELQLEQQLRTGNLSDEAKMIGDRLSRIQTNLQSQLANFASQRVSTAQSAGLEGAKAQAQTSTAYEQMRQQLMAHLVDQQMQNGRQQANETWTSQENALNRQNQSQLQADANRAQADLQSAQIAATAAQNEYARNATAANQQAAQAAAAALQAAQQRFEATQNAINIAAGKYAGGNGGVDRQLTQGLIDQIPSYPDARSALAALQASAAAIAAAHGDYNEIVRQINIYFGGQ